MGGSRQARSAPDLCSPPGIGVIQSCWQRCCLFPELGQNQPALLVGGQSCHKKIGISFCFPNDRISTLWGLFLLKGWVRLVGFSSLSPWLYLSHGPGLGHREIPTWLMPEPRSLQSLTNSDTDFGEVGGTHRTPSSLKHQHPHSFSKDSLILGWPFLRINMVPEVLKVLCGLIKAVCRGWVGGRG